MLSGIRQPSVLLLLSLASGCTLVYEIEDSSRATSTFEAQPGSVAQGPELQPATPLEECNGVDDDRDGAIDEGYEDFTGDGVADCDGPTCPALDVGTPLVLPSVSACGATTGVIQDAWGAKASWRWSSASAEFISGASAIVVGQLDDDNNDGVIDEADSLMILQSALANPDVYSIAEGTTLVLNGSTGEVKWSREGGAWVGALVADVDSDGDPNVVTQGEDGSLVALDSQGHLKWELVARAGFFTPRPPIATDLTGDGRVELVYGTEVIDGRTGRPAFSLDEPLPDADGVATAADLDLDGLQELFFQGQVFDPSGALLWKAEITARRALWPVILEADTDREGEIAWVGRDYGLWNADGSPIAYVSGLGGEQAGAPCAGDLDGDGHVEIAWANEDYIVAIDVDGSLLWKVPRLGDSPVGCATFDLDGDNSAEVLILDGEKLRVLEGGTGLEHSRQDVGMEATRGAYPLVADLDVDGHAEILVSGLSPGGGAALAVYTHDGAGWSPAGSAWPSYDYTIGNLLANGTVPRNPGAWWSEFATLRGRPAGDLVSRPDLLAWVTDTCVADCDFGPIRLAVQVGNQGARDQYAGGLLVVYALEEGKLRELTSTRLSAIPMGYAPAGVEFELAPEDLRADAWVVRIEDDGSDVDYLNDCDLANQQVWTTPPACP